MAMALIIILFIGFAIVGFSNVIAINKIVVKRLFVSQSRLTKSDWSQIGRHFLFIVLGLIVFVVLIILVYYFGFWRTGGSSHS
jgi:hypothetical protein